jgi:hypothetical protein
MMQLNWRVFLGIFLILLSVILYFLDNYIEFIGDLKYIPIEVLFVTLIVDNLLSRREKLKRMEKLNMVIGTFFSEVGTNLLIHFSNQDPNLETIRNHLIIDGDWDDIQFDDVTDRLKKYEYKVKNKNMELKNLNEFLKDKSNFLLRLLENPNLLEHEEFTGLLRAVFHLTEELASRENLNNLTQNDLDHLKGDIERVYSKLVIQWIDYMKYLKKNYPYLFSLALRKNPFDLKASPMIK